MSAMHMLTLCAAACEGAWTAEHERGPSCDTRGKLMKRSLGVYSSCNTACKPQSEMTFKVLFMSSTGCTQSFPSRVLSPTMNWHRQEWPQSRARVCMRACVCAHVWLCVCASEATAIRDCRLFHSWCFHFPLLVTDKCFPTVPTYKRL